MLSFYRFYDLYAWRGCWFFVHIRRFIYKYFKCVSFWLHGCCREWKDWARKPVNYTSLVAVVTATDRPQSVCNHCVIELFVALFVLSLCSLDNFVGKRVFFQRTESDLFTFSLWVRTSYGTCTSVILHLSRFLSYFISQLRWWGYKYVQCKDIKKLYLLKYFTGMSIWFHYCLDLAERK